MVTYFPATDATHEAPDELHYPEVVERLESLGFVRVGRLRLAVPPAEWEALLATYTPGDAAELAYHEAIPGVVLVAPDGDAYVDVDWFYESPSIRFRTLLEDGTVVETQRAWDNDPAWPVRLHRAVKYRIRREEQLLEAADGRDLAVAGSSDVGGVWEEHRARLARAESPPAAHSGDMGQLLPLWNRFLEHGMRCAVRASRVARIFTMALPLLAAVVSVWLTATDRLLAAIAVVLLGLVLVLLTPRIAIRTRYVRRLRPAWR
ncbi:MAG TPA: hypothetical protein VFK52_09675 [Nocardioidaceae bacterium]|nr:hypothetical protein [Nocardioidaceae bacterium]